jgi:hypothetical protein
MWKFRTKRNLLSQVTWMRRYLSVPTHHAVCLPHITEIWGCSILVKTMILWYLNITAGDESSKSFHSLLAKQSKLSWIVFSFQALSTVRLCVFQATNFTVFRAIDVSRCAVLCGLLCNEVVTSRYPTENKVLTRMFERQRKQAPGGYRKLHCEGLHTSYSSRNIIRWQNHVFSHSQGSDMRDMYHACKKWKTLHFSADIKEDNLADVGVDGMTISKWILKKQGVKDTHRSCLEHGKVQWRVPVNTVM